MEHIEEAGVHSGDSACSVPPYSLRKEIIKEIEIQTTRLALSLNVVGLINIQFAVKNGDIYVLEVNPRASRTVPFISKAIGIPVAKIAARIMAGEKLKKFNLEKRISNIFAIKEAVFPFNKFPNVDVLLGPEMKSTGEVMGIDKSFGLAYYKAQLAAGMRLPTTGKVFISVADRHKPNIVEIAKEFTKLGFKLVATRGTHKFLKERGIGSEIVFKYSEGGRPNIVDLILNKEMNLKV